MKLTKFHKEAVIRAIMQDVPKPDKTARYAKVQAAFVKAMSPECRKVYNKTPKALVSHYVGDITYDGFSSSTRGVIRGDVSSDKTAEILKPYEDEQKAYDKAKQQLCGAIMACTTLKQLKATFPEFEKYLPTEAAPTKNLPALANVVADLSKLGWPKQQPKT
jgi:hypothetical protein